MPGNPYRLRVLAGQNAKNFWPFAHFFWPFSDFSSKFLKKPKNWSEKVGRKWPRFSDPFSEGLKNRPKKGPFFVQWKLVFSAENHKIGLRPYPSFTLCYPLSTLRQPLLYQKYQALYSSGLELTQKYVVPNGLR